MPPEAISMPATLYWYADRVRIVAGRYEVNHPREFVAHEGSTAQLVRSLDFSKVVTDLLPTESPPLPRQSPRVFVFEVRKEIQTMTKQLEACCSSLAVMCYWFVVALITWGVLSTTTTGARSTRPGMADHGRVIRCISFTAQLERTWKCRAVACVYARLVCGVIRTDL